MRHLREAANRTVRHGVRLWHQARHYGHAIDTSVRYAANLYGTAIQPVLQGLGVDTRTADRTLKASYDNYNLLKSNVDSGIRVTNAVMSQLQGGLYEYPGH